MRGFTVTLLVTVLGASGMLAQAESAAVDVALQDIRTSMDSRLVQESPRIDSVVVRKKERVLFLMSGESPVRAYSVALGDVPLGHKRYEGDERTPEGRYVLDWRNHNSRFYKSIHVSYPNAADHEYALASGFSPGGMIMLHGWPTERSPKFSLDKLLNTDWTDGCIAVSNTAMDEIWELVPDGTPIEIQP